MRLSGGIARGYCDGGISTLRIAHCEFGVAVERAHRVKSNVGSGRSRLKRETTACTSSRSRSISPDSNVR